MAWSPTASFTPFNWKDGQGNSGGDTAISAADLQASATTDVNYVMAQVENLATYVDTQDALAVSLTTTAGGATTGDATRSSTLGVPVLRDFVSLKDAPFNCKFDGVTDDAAGWRSATDYVSTNGGTIWAPAGTSYLNSTDASGDAVRSAVNSPGVRYQGAGWGVTTIKLGPTCPRFIEPKAGYAAYSTWTGIAVMDMTVDYSTVGGTPNCSIIGTVKAGGAVQAQLNVSNIFVFRVRFTGVPIASNLHVRPIAIALQDVSASTPMTGTDIFFEKCEANGGCMGYTVTGGVSGGTALNCVLDRIYFTDLYHDCGATPSANVIPFANYQIGQSAAGGHHIVLTNCYGKNSADVAIELDSVLFAVCRRCTMVDCWTNHFYFTAFNTGTNFSAAQQRIVFDHCVAIAAVLVNSIGAYACIEKNSVALGEMVLRGCRYEKTCSTSSGSGVVAGIRSNSSGYGYALQVGQATVLTSLLALYVDDFTILDQNSIWATGNQYSAYVNLNLGTASPTLLKVGINYNIATQNNGTIYAKWLFVVNGNFVLLDGCELNVSYAGTGDHTGSLTIAYLGGTTTGGNPAASTSTAFGRLKVNIQSITGDTAPNGVQVAGTATLTIPSQLRVDFDTANWVGSSARINLAATAQTAVVDGGLGFATLAGGGGRFWSGSGAPSKPGGVNPTAGDGYWRTDTPTVANQRLYICTVGGATPTWVGLL